HGKAYCTRGRDARAHRRVALTRRPDLPRAENMVVIAVPITEVFAYIADGTNNPQWRPGVMDITPPEDGPDEGAVYGQGLRGPKGQRIDGDYRITDYQPPNRLAFEVIAGPARPTGAFGLEEPGAGAATVRFSLDHRGVEVVEQLLADAGADLGPHPEGAVVLVDDHRLGGLRDGAEDRRPVHRRHAPGVEHFGLHALLLREPLGGGEAVVEHEAVGDDREGVALPLDLGLADRDVVVLVRDLARDHAVTLLVLEVEDRVRVVERRAQQPLGV